MADPHINGEDSLNGRRLVDLTDMYFTPGTVPELAGAIMATSSNSRKLRITLLFVGMPDTRKDKEAIPARAKESIIAHLVDLNGNCKIPATKEDCKTPLLIRAWRSQLFELTYAMSVEVPKAYHLSTIPRDGNAVPDDLINYVLGEHCNHVRNLTPDQICEISNNPAIVERECFYFRGSTYKFKA